MSEVDMTQVSARLPDELVRSVDRAARRLKRTRAEIIRHALEYYLEDQEDLALALERLQDPADPVLDWDEVKRGLLDPHQG
jgi:transposase